VAIFNYIPHNLKIKPQPTAGTQIAVSYDFMALKAAGLNMQVLISEYLPNNSKKTPKSVAVMGHFDTGASATCIDFRLANMLGLVPIGTTIIKTANGISDQSNYIVRLEFPNTALKSFEKIQITSANLCFDPKQNSNAKNFGILIGRDIMARWNIVWNGPTSSVFISD